MSRYAVYVKIMVEADSMQEARETVDSELEDVVPFEEHVIQNVKKAGTEIDEIDDVEDDIEDGDDIDPDM